MARMLCCRFGAVLGLTLLLGLLLSPGPLPFPNAGLLGVAEAGSQDPVAYAGNWSFIEPGDEVFLSALGSYDPDDDVNDNGRIDGNETNNLTLYEWDFEGDGIYDWSNESHGNVPHKYTEEGNFSATLRVTDPDGNTATAVFWVFAYEDEDKEEDPELSDNFYLGVAVGSIGFGIFLSFLAQEIRRRYYTDPSFAVPSKEELEKAQEERRIADQHQEQMKSSRETGNQDQKPGKEGQEQES